MIADIVTIFPDYLSPLGVSLLGKARERGILTIRVHDLRRWTDDVHRTVDDAPYGGGPGMVMRPQPWYAALRHIAVGEAVASGAVPGGVATGGVATGGVATGGVATGGVATGGVATDGVVGSGSAVRPRVVVPTPAGRPFTQAYAAELARAPWLVFCCGRYEGIDARFVDAWADDEISIGDYVLAGGEVATLVILEAVTRLLPGVVGNACSVADDSFSDGLLEAPAYTRPPVWDGREVPAVLRSGDHGAIARWRRLQSLHRTATRRPDLLERAGLSDADRRLLASPAHGDTAGS